MKWRRYLGLSLMAAVAAGVFMAARHAREPEYRGRTLSAWLAQRNFADPGASRGPVREAVRAMGVANVLPCLLRMVRAENGPIKSWLARQNKVPFLKVRRAEADWELAAGGFEALGTNGAPAIPELTQLLDDPKHAFTAVRCLTWVGKPAELALCAALTNRDWNVRRFSIVQLPGVTDDPQLFLARVKNRLGDAQPVVRAAAVAGVGLQVNVPDEAIPILIAALKDPDGDVGAAAARALCHFKNDGMQSLSALRNAVENGNPTVELAALKAVLALAPQDGLALVFQQLRASDPNRRRNGVGILCNLPEKTPEILSAITAAAGDPDPRVAMRAKAFLTLRARAVRGNEIIAGEPSCDGKTLGEWLRERGNGDMLSPAAEEALRQMGTNAVPALLERLVYVDPPYGLPAYEVNMEAAMGLMALRQQAAAAVPRLEALMNGENEETALHVLVATSTLGLEAIPCQRKGLTNQHPLVRSQALDYLAANPAARWPGFKPQLVPQIVRLLGDPNETVRMNATNALEIIDPAEAGVWERRAGAR